MENQISRSEQETQAIAKQIAGTLQGGDVLCLFGELGAGKTTFVKGLAEYFGVKENITSPTFTLMNVYSFNHALIRNLVHIDTYRLKNAEELLDIGVEDFLGTPDTVTIVEWPEKIEKLLRNKKVINVRIDHQGESGRLITIG